MNSKEKMALKIIQKNKGNITLSVFAVKMNIKYSEAQELLKSIIKKYKCSFLVTENGELIYDFGEDFSLQNSSGEKIKYILSLFLKIITEFSFGLLYITLRWTVWLPVYLTGKLIKNDTTDSSKISNADLNDIINIIRPENSRITNFTIPHSKDLNRFSCASRIRAEFVNKWHWKKLRRSKQDIEFMKYINAVGGIVSAMDWAILFDTSLDNAEKAITSLYIKYQADIRVSESGGLFFDFSAELSKNNDKPPVPKFYETGIIKLLLPPEKKTLAYVIVLTTLFLVSYTAIALTLISLFSDVPFISGWLDNNNSIFFLSILPGLLIMIINWPAYTYPIFGLMTLFLVAGVLLVVAEFIFKFTGNTEILTNITTLPWLNQKPTMRPVMIAFGVIWISGSALSFPVTLISSVKHFISMKGRNRWFRMALHSYLVKYDTPIPATPSDAARFLNKYTPYKVPLPSVKGFIQTMDALKADFKNDKYYFTVINAQKNAILTEKPLHEVSKTIIYSSNDSKL